MWALLVCFFVPLSVIFISDMCESFLAKKRSIRTNRLWLDSIGHFNGCFIRSWRQATGQRQQTWTVKLQVGVRACLWTKIKAKTFFFGRAVWSRDASRQLRIIYSRCEVFDLVIFVLEINYAFIMIISRSSECERHFDCVQATAPTRTSSGDRNVDLPVA